MIPAERAPRPDGQPTETEKRGQLVAQFYQTIDTAVEQMRTGGPAHTAAGFPIKDLGLTYRMAVRNAAGASFEVTHNLKPKDPSIFLEANFRPHRQKIEGVGLVDAIVRTVVLDDENDRSRSVVGNRYLNFEEMQQLVDAMESPPLHVSRLEDLIKPTELEQASINEGLTVKYRA